MSRRAIAGLVMGIISLVASPFGIYFIVLPIAGIINSGVGLAESVDNAGKAVSIIGLAICIIATVLMIVRLIG